MKLIFHHSYRFHVLETRWDVPRTLVVRHAPTQESPLVFCEKVGVKKWHPTKVDVLEKGLVSGLEVASRKGAITELMALNDPS
jgi:hypothetical protein